MSVAVDASPRYFGTHLSDNIAETPEGYLICRNAVIGRSGFQTYFVSELTDPEGVLEGHSGSEEIEIWRDPSEVFSAATLASFEGKTFTVAHPSYLLGPEDEQEHHQGHAQNVRKGTEALDSGDLPMLADIIVTGAEGIERIRNGERQLSCGYSYRLVKEGSRYDQRAIVGNHIALVPKGRAGANARINDEAIKKEPPVKNEFLKRIFGLGLKAFATDAKPEELAAAIEEVGSSDKAAPSAPRYLKIGRTADGVDIFRSFATDEEMEAEKKKIEKEEKAGDGKGKDAEMCSKCENPMDKCTCGKGKDAVADDARRRMHDAVDRLMGLKDMKDMASGKDADLEELKTLLGQFFTEEENEAEHAAKGDDEKAIEKEQEEAGDANEVAPISLSDEEKVAEAEKEKAKKEEGKDAADIVRAEPYLDASQVPQSQFDGARMVLRCMKPFVAKSGDKKLIAAFDTIARKVILAGKSESGHGSYALFGDATRRSRAGDQGPAESAAQKTARENDEMYRKEREKRGLRKRAAA